MSSKFFEPVYGFFTQRLNLLNPVGVFGHDSEFLWNLTLSLGRRESDTREGVFKMLAVGVLRYEL